ncbi:MAG: hypothetical protein ACE3K2_20475, partial [Paenibacillus sp.]|uniref:hypothetical protein n=1 Tax=Paenibacillus sp. TaxID=58172 RepID=UPI003B805992
MAEARRDQICRRHGWQNVIRRDVLRHQRLPAGEYAVAVALGVAAGHSRRLHCVLRRRRQALRAARMRGGSASPPRGRVGDTLLVCRLARGGG